MKLQKIVTTVTVALFAAATVQTAAFAKPKDDDDSVHSWGRWATLVQPAAGPQTPTSPLPGLGVPGYDARPFEPVVTNPEGPAGRCVAGTACGYALIEQFNSFVDSEGGEDFGPQNATPTLTPIPVGGLYEQVSHGEEGEQIALSVISNTDIPLQEGIEIRVDASEVLSAGDFDYVSWDSGQGFQTRTDNGYTDFFQFISGITLDVVGVPFAYGRSVEYTDIYVFESRDIELLDTETAFIYGDTTELDALNAGNVTASYEGFTLLSGTDVAIDVNFGEGTWSGSWNDGFDTGVSEDTDSNGVNNLSDNVGFNASGVISGVNIVSTDISATDTDLVSISGTVDGSFFGGDGSILAGGVNIDKTTEDYSGNYQDLFVTADLEKLGEYSLPEPDSLPGYPGNVGEGPGAE